MDVLRLLLTLALLAHADWDGKSDITGLGPGGSATSSQGKVPGKEPGQAEAGNPGTEAGKEEDPHAWKKRIPHTPSAGPSQANTGEPSTSSGSGGGGGGGRPPSPPEDRRKSPSPSNPESPCAPLEAALKGANNGGQGCGGIGPYLKSLLRLHGVDKDFCVRHIPTPGCGPELLRAWDGFVNDDAILARKAEEEHAKLEGHECKRYVKRLHYYYDENRQIVDAWRKRFAECPRPKP